MCIRCYVIRENPKFDQNLRSFYSIYSSRNGRYLVALLSVDVAVLAAMCFFHLPRATVVSTTSQVSGVLVELNHATCDVGHSIFFTRTLTAYHALIAFVTCAMSFKARKAGSQCETTLIHS